jgi:hypothetical protein
MSRERVQTFPDLFGAALTGGSGVHRDDRGQASLPQP